MNLDDFLNRKPAGCLLVLVPIQVESGALAVVLAMASRSQIPQAFVVTRDLASARAAMGPKIDRKTLQIFTYPTYATYIDSAGDFENTVVVFDDISSCIRDIGLDRLTSLVAQANPILILGNFGTPEAKIGQLGWTSITRDASLTKASFADYGSALTFTLHETQMTPRQDDFYTRQLASERPRPGGLYRSQRYGNLVFPEPIQQFLDSKTPTGVIVRPDPLIWVREQKIGLLNDGPKLQNLIIYLSLNRRSRHLIYTRFDGYYGVGILKALLIYFKFNVYAIDGRMRDSEATDTIQQFNSDSEASAILLTSVYPPSVIPLNIQHLHMLDGNLGRSLPLFKLTCKYRNYNGQVLPVPYCIHFHVCQHLDGSDSLDASEYRIIYRRWTRILDYWNKLYQAAVPLNITPYKSP